MLCFTREEAYSVLPSSPVSPYIIDLIEPNAETRALLNFIDKHSLKVVEHGATHHTRTTTTTSDTHIDLVLVDAHDRLLNFNKFPSPYEKNGHDLITATIELFVAEPSKASFSIVITRVSTLRL